MDDDRMIPRPTSIIINGKLLVWSDDRYQLVNPNLPPLIKIIGKFVLARDGRAGILIRDDRMGISSNEIINYFNLPSYVTELVGSESITQVLDIDDNVYCLNDDLTFSLVASKVDQISKFHHGICHIRGDRLFYQDSSTCLHSSIVEVDNGVVMTLDGNIHYVNEQLSSILLTSNNEIVDILTIDNDTTGYEVITIQGYGQMERFIMGCHKIIIRPIEGVEGITISHFHNQQGVIVDSNNNHYIFDLDIDNEGMMSLVLELITV